jgi:parallel beta-helix repeat protein
VINRNVVFGCIEGINVGAPGGRALIRLNQVNANDIGLWVTDSRAIVGRNVANGNTDYGIVSTQAGTTIQNNTANNNGSYGIFAAPGTIDGGGNTATGNGDGTTPQCENVQCSSP